MAILPVSNIINVTITDTPSGLTERNVNSLALFTTETPNNLETYGTYVSASQVAEVYGTGGITAQMANAIFAQTPNILSGRGRLVVVPLQSSVSATAGYFTTADISANLAALQAVTNGDLRVTLNGTNVDLTGVNLSSATSLADVATLLQRRLTNAVVTSTTTTITVKSKKVGVDADVVLAALPGGSGTNLATSGLLNTAAGAATSGANASGETLQAAVTRVSGSVSFTPIITNLQMQDSVIETLSDFIQARDNIVLLNFSDTNDIAGIITTITNSTNTKTRCLFYSTDIADANLMKAAYAGRGFSVNFEGSSTAQTMNLKALATITPDSGITQSVYDAALLAGADTYVSFDGVPSVRVSSANRTFNTPYENLALKFAIETAGFNYLRQTSTKVPQTETGMNGLKSGYGQVCVRYVRNGVIAPGTWTSSETIGDPEICKQNIEDTGFYIYSEPVATQNPSDRALNKAPLVQIAIKRAGAIHSSDVLVIVNG